MHGWQYLFISRIHGWQHLYLKWYMSDLYLKGYTGSKVHVFTDVFEVVHAWLYLYLKGYVHTWVEAFVFEGVQR